MFGYTSDEFNFQTPDGKTVNPIKQANIMYQQFMEKHCIKDKNYFYHFDVDIPGWDNPGKFHSVDLWFWFETLAKCWRPFTGKHYDIARKMCNYLCNFIKTGDPNGKDCDDSQMPFWENFDSSKVNDMKFSV